MQTLKSTVPQNSYTVQPVLKALRLLEALGWKTHDATLTELSRELKLPKTTAFRYLQTLAAAGFVRHDPKNDRYGIGPRLSMFAQAERSISRLRRVALPEMEKLVRTYDETINLAISSGFDIVYVEMSYGSRMQRMQARIGEHHPLHSTALGKAILAFLPPGERAAILDSPLGERTARTIRSIATLKRQLQETQRLGYSIDREETEEGFSCVGVAILDRHNYPIAALSLAAPDKRFALILEDACKNLEEAATVISAQLLD